ncbi:MAG: class II aldolase/adducin family protein [Candidatus Binatia bacterium]
MTLQEKLALACRILAMQGHSDLIYGHVSALAEEPDLYWIKGSGIGLEEVTEDDLVLIDFEGNKISGKRKRHNEFPIHSEVYRTNPDIRCVIHTHPLYSTLIASSEHRLLPITNMSCAFYPPAVRKFEESSDLIVTAEQGIAVAKLLGEHRIVLLRNHGIVVAADSIEEACVRGVLLEHSARAQVTAAAMGAFSWATDAEALLKRKRFYHPDAVQNLWHYFARQLYGTENNKR